MTNVVSLQNAPESEAQPLISDDVLAQRAVLESLGVSFVFEDAVPTSSKKTRQKKSRRSAARMNLLDHDGALLPCLQKGLMGAGIFSMIQGLLMSSVLSFFLGGLMGAGGVISKLIKTGLPQIQPIVDQTQQYLDMARATGMPVDELKTKMMDEMPRHLLPKRLIRYAMFTMLGRGGASFWLGAAGIGTVALTSPTTLTSVLGISSSVTMLAQAVILSGPDILNYRQMVRPDFVMDRIDDVLGHYNIEVKSRDIARTLNINDHDISEGIHKLQSASLSSIAMGIHRHSGHALYTIASKNTAPIMNVAAQAMDTQKYQASSIIGIAKRLASESGLGFPKIPTRNFGTFDIGAMASGLESAFEGILHQPLVHG
ncbi:MAG: hypothetical protein ACKO57_04420 [Alphaproteobacteria bacterium]